jgi:hypothetical protein
VYLPLEDHLDDAADPVVEIAEVLERALPAPARERGALLLGFVEQRPGAGEVSLGDPAEGGERLLDAGRDGPEEMRPGLPREDPGAVTLGLEEAAVDAGGHLGRGVDARGRDDLLLGAVPLPGEGEELEEEGPLLRVGGRFPDLLGQGLDRGFQVPRVEELLGSRHHEPPGPRLRPARRPSRGSGADDDDRGC